MSDINHWHVPIYEAGAIYCACDCPECTSGVGGCICEECACEVVDHAQIGDEHADVIRAYIDQRLATEG